MASLYLKVEVNVDPAVTDPMEVAEQLLEDATGPRHQNTPACGMVTIKRAEWTPENFDIVDGERSLSEANSPRLSAQ